MRTTILVGALAVIIAAFMGAALAYKNSRSQLETRPKRLHVVLIGASIGQGWRLAEWPARVQAPDCSAESIAVWRFDKTEAVEEVLMRPAKKFRLSRTYIRSLFHPPPRRPDVVILKECSSYFPGDLPVYKDSTRKWVGQLQRHNVRVMLATVVPVTRVRAAQRAGKQEMLLEYNRWLREYAGEHGLSLLDLAAAVDADGEGSYLRDEFTSGDGTHLNASAYAVFDQTLRTVLCGTRAPSGGDPVRNGLWGGNGILCE